MKLLDRLRLGVGPLLFSLAIKRRALGERIRSGLPIRAKGTGAAALLKTAASGIRCALASRCGRGLGIGALDGGRQLLSSSRSVRLSASDGEALGRARRSGSRLLRRRRRRRRPPFAPGLRLGSPRTRRLSPGRAHRCLLLRSSLVLLQARGALRHGDAPLRLCLLRRARRSCRRALFIVRLRFPALSHHGRCALLSKAKTASSYFCSPMTSTPPM